VHRRRATPSGQGGPLCGESSAARAARPCPRLRKLKDASFSPSTLEALFEPFNASGAAAAA